VDFHPEEHIVQLAINPSSFGDGWELFWPDLASFVNHPPHIPIGPARKIVTAPEKQLQNWFVREI